MSEQVTSKFGARAIDGLYSENIQFFDTVDEIRAWVMEHQITDYVYFEVTRVTINDKL